MAQENLNFRIVAIDKTRQAFASVRGGLNRVRSSVFSVRNAVVALGAGLALKQFASQIDDIAKQSRVLGFTAAQLQELQFAASQAGVSASELETGFRRFSKSISEASTGLSTPMKAFEALGVSVTNADGSLRGTDEILNDVANGMSEMQNPADAARVAMDLFGRSGAGMVNMLSGGSEKLDEMRGQFSELTIALTGPQAKAVEAANDRFDLLRRIFNSVGQQITSAVLPALANVATMLTSFVLKAFSLAIEGVRGFANSFVGLYNLLRGPKLKEMEKFTFGEKLQEGMDKILVGMGKLKAVTPDLTEDLGGLNQGFDRTGTSLEKATTGLKDYAVAAQEVKANLADAALKGIKSLEDGLVGVINGTKSAKDAFKDMARSIVNDLLKIAIQRSITGPIAGAFGSLFGKAIGGPVQNGRPYMVGERGPELFIPNSAGSIVPNKDMTGGGGTTVVQNINISTGVSQTVRAEIAQLMPQIANSAKAAVLDAKQRGGSFSKAF